MVLVMLKMELQSMYFAELTERLGEDMKIYSTQILTPFYFKIKGCIILERIRPKIKDTMDSDSPYSGFRQGYVVRGGGGLMPINDINICS